MIGPDPFAPTFVLTEVDAQTEAWQRANVIKEAYGWLDTPYRQLGYKKGAGGAVDCSMLLVGVFVGARVWEPLDPRPYPPTWFLHRDEERYLAWMDKAGAETSTPKPGDVVMYKVGRCFAHAGILVDENHVIHAYAKMGRCMKTERAWPELANRPQKFYDPWAYTRKGV